MVHGNEVQYLLDECTIVNCCFTLNQRENEGKGKDELLMTYLGYGKAT